MEPTVRYYMIVPPTTSTSTVNPVQPLPVNSVPFAQFPRLPLPQNPTQSRRSTVISLIPLNSEPRNTVPPVFDEAARRRMEPLITAAVCDKPTAEKGVQYFFGHLPTEEFEKLTTVVANKETGRNQCVAVPRTPSGLVQMDWEGGVLHIEVSVLTFRVWRLADSGTVPLHYTKSCRLKDNGSHVCGNPYHVERVPRVGRGVNCVVADCKSNSAKRVVGVGFFRLPDKIKSPERYRMFFAASGRKDLRDFAGKHRICSLHFRPEDIARPRPDSGVKPSLSPKAVPLFHCKATPLARPPRREIHRHTAEEVQSAKEKRFWTSVTSPDFDLKKLDPSELGWKLLSHSNSEVLFARSRLLFDPIAQTVSSAADVVLLRDNLTFNLRVNGKAILPGVYDGELPWKVDSNSALLKVLRFDFQAGLESMPVEEVVVVEETVKDLTFYCSEVQTALGSLLEFVEDQAKTLPPDITPISAPPTALVPIDEITAASNFLEMGEPEPESTLPSNRSPSPPPSGPPSRRKPTIEITLANQYRQISTILRFCREVLRNTQTRKVTSRRYSPELVQLCRDVRKCSVKGYGVLRAFFGKVLPSYVSLREKPVRPTKGDQQGQVGDQAGDEPGQEGSQPGQGADAVGEELVTGTLGSAKRKRRKLTEKVVRVEGAVLDATGSGLP